MGIDESNTQPQRTLQQRLVDLHGRTVQSLQPTFQKLLARLTDAEVVEQKMSMAKLAFMDPEIEMDPDKPANYDPDDEMPSDPEHYSEYHDADTEIYLVLLDCCDLELERRAQMRKESEETK